MVVRKEKRSISWNGSYKTMKGGPCEKRKTEKKHGTHTNRNKETTQDDTKMSPLKEKKNESTCIGF
jgi:hypothetical protein